MVVAMPEPDTLNVGCGTDTAPDRWDVDAIELEGVDETHDLDVHPWPWPADEFDEVRAEHVLEHLEDLEGALKECARVLRPGGRLVVELPIGQNATADPDHSWGGGFPWTWDTPRYYCGSRHWDTDLGLELVDRDVDVHSHLPGHLGGLYQRAIDALERVYGPGRWMFDLPATSGTFRVVMRR